MTDERPMETVINDVMDDLEARTVIREADDLTGEQAEALARLCDELGVPRD